MVESGMMRRLRAEREAEDETEAFAAMLIEALENDPKVRAAVNRVVTRATRIIPARGGARRG